MVAAVSFDALCFFPLPPLLSFGELRFRLFVDLGGTDAYGWGLLFRAGETEVKRSKSSMLPTYAREEENIDLGLERIGKSENMFNKKKNVKHSLYIKFD